MSLLSKTFEKILLTANFRLGFYMKDIIMSLWSLK